jgi:hypothetical protein
MWSVTVNVLSHLSFNLRVDDDICVWVEKDKCNINVFVTVIF